MGLKQSKIYKIYRNIIRVDEINKRTFEIEDKVDKINITELKEKVDNFTEQNKIMLLELESIKSLARENNYANIYHDSIKNSKYENIPLSLSSAAIDYPFAYILFKILHEIEPKKF